jgi:hypothetical protein
MPIYTTLGVLMTADPALTAIGTLKLSAKSAYHVMKLQRLVAQETRHFQQQRNAVIEELGTPLEGGGFTILPDSAHWSTYVTRVQELAAVSVEIPWSPVTLEMFGEEPVSAQTLTALGPLLAEAPS